MPPLRLVKSITYLLLIPFKITISLFVYFISLGTNVISWLPLFKRRPDIPADDDYRLEVSCPQNPPLDTTNRHSFGRGGCTVYGYPSTGGVLMKEVDLVDMQFLQLDRFRAAQRSLDLAEEDEFCTRMRKIGATWWESKEAWIEVHFQMRDLTASENQQLIFGWPTNGEGVWFLRYEDKRKLPEDFGKMSLAQDMDERCQIRKEYRAAFYADPEAIEEWTRGP